MNGEYDRAVRRLNALLDGVGTNERHPLYSLLDTLGTLIHAYEEEHFEEREPSGAEMLQFFMEEHELTASNLPELGSRRAVSEILSGKRELTAKQIRALADCGSIPRFAYRVHIRKLLLTLTRVDQGRQRSRHAEL